MINTQRYVNIGLVGVAIVTYLFVMQLADAIWGVVRLPVPSSLPFTPAVMIGAVCGLVVFVILKRSSRVNVFLNEVVSELAKVTWPPKKETLLSTVVVSIMVAVCAVILFTFDTFWGTLVKALYR